MHNDAEQHDAPRTMTVKYSSEEGSSREREECLKRDDPGDGAGGVFLQLIQLILRLQDTHAVDPAQRAELSTPTATDDGPGGPTAIEVAVVAG